jgi:hypothetical protein
MSGVYADANSRTATQKTKIDVATPTAKTVYTCPSSAVAAKLIHMRIVNTDATNTDTAVVEIVQASPSVTYTYVASASIPNNGIYEIEFHGFRLAPSDLVQITASAANDLHVFVTAAEVQGRGG